MVSAILSNFTGAIFTVYFSRNLKKMGVLIFEFSQFFDIFLRVFKNRNHWSMIENFVSQWICESGIGSLDGGYNNETHKTEDIEIKTQHWLWSFNRRSYRENSA